MSPLDAAAEHERLTDLARTGLLDSGAEEEFDRVTRLARRLFDVSGATVSLIERDRQVLKSVAGDLPLEHRGARELSFCSTTIEGPGAMVIEDTRRDSRFRDHPLVLGDPRLRFYAGVPLTGPGGYNIGTFCIIDQQPRVFPAGHAELLADLAAVIQREVNVHADYTRAARVQQSLLPGASPVAAGWETAAVSQPAGPLGGDFHEWFSAEGQLRFAVADAMGKGTGAALVAGTVRAALRAAVACGFPAAARAVLDADLASSESFVTGFYAEIAVDSGVLSFSDAGHGLAHVVRSDGAVQRLGSTAPPVGVIPGQPWGRRELRLEPGDCLLVPSDGLLDLHGNDLQALAGHLAGLAREPDLGSAVGQLASAARPLPDDLTLVAVRRTTA